MENNVIKLELSETEATVMTGALEEMLPAALAIVSKREEREALEVGFGWNSVYRKPQAALGEKPSKISDMLVAIEKSLDTSGN